MEVAAGEDDIMTRGNALSKSAKSDILAF